MRLSLYFAAWVLEGITGVLILHYFFLSAVRLNLKNGLIGTGITAGCFLFSTIVSLPLAGKALLILLLHGGFMGVLIFYYYPGNWWKKLVYLLPCFGIEYLLYSIPFFVSFILYDYPVSTERVAAALEQISHGFEFAGSILIVLGMGLAVWCRRPAKVEAQLGFLDHLIVVLMMIVSGILFLIVIALPDLIKMNPQLTKLFRVSLSSLSILLIIFTFILLLKSRTTFYDKKLEKVNREQLQLQLQYFEEYKQSHMKLRQFRHDLKNHLQTLHYYTDKAAYADLDRYLEKLLKKMNQSSRMIQSGNDILDAVLFEQADRKVNQPLRIDCSGSFEKNIKIDDLTLSIIFMNALNYVREQSALEEGTETVLKVNLSQEGFFQKMEISIPFNEKPDSRSIKWFKTRPIFSGNYKAEKMAALMKEHQGIVKLEKTVDRLELDLIFPDQN